MKRGKDRLLNRLVVLLTGIFLVLPVPLSAQEAGKVMGEVVVTATRIPTPAEEVGSSITIVPTEEIKHRNQTMVRETLKGVLGLDVTGGGGPGQMTSVFLRGAESYHTLVLMDGIKMNDPTGANRGFNFGNLTVDNIERIEILRGPQSTLYGADAMGGVINIITKKGKGKPVFTIGAEGGSYKTWREFGEVSTGSKQGNASLAFSHNSSDGFSSADADLSGNSEDDKWENTSVGARIGFVLSENVDLDLTGRFYDGRTHLDMGGGPYQDAEDYLVEERNAFTRAQVHVSLLDGFWEQSLAYGYSDYSHDYHDDPWSGDYSYDGKRQEISWQNNFYLHKTNTLTLGLGYEREEMDAPANLDESAYTSSFFAQDQIKLRGFSFTTFGLRYDDHEEFGDKTTFRITQAFLVEDWGTKFKGSYGTGFRAPSLNELHYVNPWGGPGGNPNLAPEKSKGWDIGVEQSLCGNHVKLGITYFYNDFNDLITWDNGYKNLDTAKTRGIESFGKVVPFDDLSFGLNYTYTDTEDDQGKRLLRRPLQKVGFNTCFHFLARGTVNLDVLYVGKRDDSYWDAMTFAPKGVITDEYTLVNLAGSFDIGKHLQIFARVDNLFDEKYYESYGYGTARLSAYGGLKVTF